MIHRCPKLEIALAWRNRDKRPLYTVLIRFWIQSDRAGWILGLHLADSADNDHYVLGASQSEHVELVDVRDLLEEFGLGVGCCFGASCRRDLQVVVPQAAISKLMPSLYEKGCLLQIASQAGNVLDGDPDVEIGPKVGDQDFSHDDVIGRSPKGVER